MIISVLSAMNLSMRIDCTCSLTVTSVAECGIIFPLIGPGDRRFSNVSSMQDQDLSILSSLKLCSLQLGIYGSSGMEGLSEEKMQPLLLGDVILYMT